MSLIFRMVCTRYIQYIHGGPPLPSPPPPGVELGSSQPTSPFECIRSLTWLAICRRVYIDDMAAPIKFRRCSICVIEAALGVWNRVCRWLLSVPRPLKIDEKAGLGEDLDRAGIENVEWGIISYK